MLRLNPLIKSLSITLISASALIACDPSFKTTAQECITFDPVRLGVPSYEVQTDDPNNEYKLYLEDALNSLRNLQSTTGNSSAQPLSADEQTAIDFVIGRANLFLGYKLKNDGTVESATNALDFLESLIAATDNNETIQTFVNAKNNVARAIAKEDSNCNYSNDAIEVQEEEFIENDPDLLNIKSFFNAQLDITYIPPFKTGENSKVNQVINISLNEPLPGQVDNAEDAKKLLNSFNGFQRVKPEDFNAIGVSPPEVRQLTVSDADTNETFFFDDDFAVLKLGQIVSQRFNTFCRDEDNEITTCDAGVTPREPAHPACEGGLDAEGVQGPDQTGQVQINHLEVVPGLDSLTEIQRLRLEVDYPANEIRLYASKYAETILKAGFTLDNYDPQNDVIKNPTDCEKQAVLKDLNALVTDEERNAPDFQGVRLTVVEDPNYDVIETTDENDVVTEIEPTPIFTFQGTVIPGRQ